MPQTWNYCMLSFIDCERCRHLPKGNSRWTQTYPMQFPYLAVTHVDRPIKTPSSHFAKSSLVVLLLAMYVWDLECTQRCTNPTVGGCPRWSNKFPSKTDLKTTQCVNLQFCSRAGFRGIDTACQPKHYQEDLVGAALARLAQASR